MVELLLLHNSYRQEEIRNVKTLFRSMSSGVFDFQSFMRRLSFRNFEKDELYEKYVNQNIRKGLPQFQTKQTTVSLRIFRNGGGGTKVFLEGLVIVKKTCIKKVLNEPKKTLTNLDWVRTLHHPVMTLRDVLRFFLHNYSYSSIAG